MKKFLIILGILTLIFAFLDVGANKSATSINCQVVIIKQVQTVSTIGTTNDVIAKKSDVANYSFSPQQAVTQKPGQKMMKQKQPLIATQVTLSNYVNKDAEGFVFLNLNLNLNNTTRSWIENINGLVVVRSGPIFNADGIYFNSSLLMAATKLPPSNYSNNNVPKKGTVKDAAISSISYSQVNNNMML